MAQMNRIKVVIDNIVYELSSGESIEYIQMVANYIDRKIKSIYSVKSEGAINPSLRTLFISLNIADDLFKEKDRVKELEREAAGLRKEIATLKEKNERLEKGQPAAKGEPKAESRPEPDKAKPAHKPAHKQNSNQNPKPKTAENARTPQINAPINVQTKLEDTAHKPAQQEPYEVPMSKERT